MKEVQCCSCRKDDTEGSHSVHNHIQGTRPLGMRQLNSLDVGAVAFLEFGPAPHKSKLVTHPFQSICLLEKHANRMVDKKLLKRFTVLHELINFSKEIPYSKPSQPPNCL